MKNKLSIHLTLLCFLFIGSIIKAQDSLNVDGLVVDSTETIYIEDKYAEDAFVGLKIVNSQTTRMQYPRSWFFEIQHRFGKIGLDSTILQQFLGLDLPANIRFALGWSFSDRFYVSIGRTNFQKTVDLESKYLLFKQTKDFKMPVSVALYFNASVRTEKFPTVPKNAFFDDTVTAFVYKPSHKLAYNSQIIISSKINDRLSLQLTPIFVYQNLVPIGYDNYTFSLSAGGRYKFGLRSALIFEYAYVFNNRAPNFTAPASLGVEFGTGGHVFQVFVSTSSKILESHVYTNNGTDITKGEFLIGFNILRNFWRKPKKIKE